MRVRGYCVVQEGRPWENFLRPQCDEEKQATNVAAPTLCECHRGQHILENSKHHRLLLFSCL